MISRLKKNKNKKNKIKPNEESIRNLKMNYKFKSFCLCVGNDVMIYDYIYKLITQTNMNIFKLTKLLKK